MTAERVATIGCRLNLAEGEAIAALLAGQREARVAVNTCGVTAEAVRSSRDAVKRMHRTFPEARIAVTGCASEIDPAAFLAMPGVAEVVPNARKLDPAVWGSTPLPAPAAPLRRARAFVPVQNGCDHACTFCIIPQGRGASRSIPADEVVRRIATLVAAGVNEVVLTGVDVTSWGSDFHPGATLGTLVERILTQVPALPRLRLSSVDSIEIDPLLENLIASEPRVMPHLHLSLQSGDPLILKRMRRRHRREDAVALVSRLRARRPEIAIGADLIAGFPTEDAAMAANSLSLIEELNIVHAHIFPYSPRAGTPAARMPQVPPPVVRERAARLRAAAADARARWLADRRGAVVAVLAERGGTGHAPDFAPVRTPDLPPGRIASMRITGVDDAGVLTGVPA